MRMRGWIACSLDAEETLPPVAGLVVGERRSYS